MDKKRISDNTKEKEGQQKGDGWEGGNNDGRKPKELRRKKKNSNNVTRKN